MRLNLERPDVPGSTAFTPNLGGGRKVSTARAFCQWHDHVPHTVPSIRAAASVKSPMVRRVPMERFALDHSRRRCTSPRQLDLAPSVV